MSSDPTTIVAIYQSVAISDFCGYSTAALLAFEYLITFDQEVELFWKRRFTGASALFFFNRYLALICVFLNGFNVPMSDASCASYIKAIFAIDFFQYLPWATFSGLRAYALCRRRWPLAAIVFLLSLGPAAVNYAQFGFNLTGEVDPTFGCVEDVSLGTSLSKTFTIVSRSCLIGADVLLIAITWAAIPGALQLHKNLGETFLPLTWVLWRNGVLYFVILLALNVLHLVCTMISLVSTLSSFSYVTIFTEPMTAILVSRFLLDLQRASRRSSGMGPAGETLHSSNSDTVVTGGTIAFARFVGSLSSSIASGLDHNVADMEMVEQPSSRDTSVTRR